MSNIKEDISTYIALHTSLETSSENSLPTALRIGAIFHLSRNTASQYLNELVSEGRLVKIITRPVYFCSKEILTQKYGDPIGKSKFSSLEELRSTLNQSIDEKKSDPFTLATGSDGGLYQCIEQCKAGISYPGNGLPILLNGPTGTGKSFLAKLVYEYAVTKGILLPTSPFLVLNCSEYANNPDLLAANIFGSKKGSFTGAEKDNPGLLQVADGGIFFLDEIHSLGFENQEKLFLVMDRGIYHMLGDNEKWYTTKIKFIFATTETPEKVLLKTLLRRIPIIVQVPPLSERPRQEKEELILTFFNKESRKLKRKIVISRQTFSALMNYDFPGNVGQLENCVLNTCANSLIHSENQDPIIIRMYNLPEYIQESKKAPLFSIGSENDMIAVDGFPQKAGIYNHKTFRSAMANICSLYDGTDDSGMTFYSSANKILENFYKKSLSGIVVSAEENRSSFEQIVYALLKKVEGAFNITLRPSDISAFTVYLSNFIRKHMEYDEVERKNEEIFNICLSELQKKFPREKLFCTEIADLILQNTDIILDSLGMIMLFVYSNSAGHMRGHQKVFGLILGKGIGFASGITTTANRIIGDMVFECMDLPFETTVQELGGVLRKRLSRISPFQEVILLVDDFPIHELNSEINSLSEIAVGIITNIGTKLAVDVGYKISEGWDLKRILEACGSKNYSDYQVTDNRTRKKAILSVCETGIGIATKIASLFARNIPASVGIEIIPYEYEKLKTKGHSDYVFDEYSILFIIGTIDPCIQEIPFLPLESIMSDAGVPVLKSFLKKYMTEDSVTALLESILRDFSISNLMEHLTILDAGKLMDHITSAIEKLEENLSISVSNQRKLGLYLHVGCLIERLVTRQSSVSADNPDDFRRTHALYISAAKNAFSVVEQYYSVDIPLTELIYIYNYIS